MSSPRQKINTILRDLIMREGEGKYTPATAVDAILQVLRSSLPPKEECPNHDTFKTADALLHAMEVGRDKALTEVEELLS